MIERTRSQLCLLPSLHFLVDLIYIHPRKKNYVIFLFLSNRFWRYGQEFFRLNFEALEAYSACATSEEVSVCCGVTWHGIVFFNWSTGIHLLFYLNTYVLFYLDPHNLFPLLLSSLWPFSPLHIGRCIAEGFHENPSPRETWERGKEGVGKE